MHSVWLACTVLQAAFTARLLWLAWRVERDTPSPPGLAVRVLCVLGDNPFIVLMLWKILRDLFLYPVSLYGGRVAYGVAFAATQPIEVMAMLWVAASLPHEKAHRTAGGCLGFLVASSLLNLPSKAPPVWVRSVIRLRDVTGLVSMGMALAHAYVAKRPKWFVVAYFSIHGLHVLASTWSHTKATETICLLTFAALFLVGLLLPARWLRVPRLHRRATGREPLRSS